MARHRAWAGLGLVTAAALATGCASRGAVPRPFPTPDLPRPAAPAGLPGSAAPAAAGVPISAATSAVLTTALTLLGAPYRPGGTDPAGFDCSGFVQYVFWQHGVALPRTVAALAESGAPAGRPPEAGDLVFFAIDHSTITHVGIALGPDRFVHAPSSRGVVRTELLAAPYWATRFRTTRRVLPSSQWTTAH